MREAISAYRHITVTPEFQEMERLRSKARHDEASALDEVRREERKKWQGVVADKDAENERLRKQLADLQNKLER